MNRPKWTKKEDCTWIPTLVITAAMIFVLFAIGLKINQNKRINAIMYCGDKTYYIDSYEYPYNGDFITATDIYGQKLLLPKNNTIVKRIERVKR